MFSIDRMKRKRDIDGLNRALQDTDSEKRHEASYALACLAKDDDFGHPSSLPFLEDALFDSNSEVRENAVGAIGYLAKLEIGRESTFFKLARATKDSDSKVGNNAIIALKELVTGVYFSDATYIPKLNESLEDNVFHVRAYAAFALGRMALKGIREKSSIPYLENNMRDSHFEVRWRAAFALACLADNGGIGRNSSIPLFERTLSDNDEMMRQCSVIGLKVLAKELGLVKESSIPLLKRRFGDSSHDIQQDAKEAVSIITEILAKREKKEDRIRKKKKAEEERSRQEAEHKAKDEADRKAKEEAECQARLAEDERKREEAEHKAKEEAIHCLSSSVILEVPHFLEPGSTAEIMIILNNSTKENIEKVFVDTSDMDEYFDTRGEVSVNSLRSGMEIRKAIRIKPKFEEGTFPVKIKITGSGVTIEKQYTIKVGGTEIY
ncbi:hypothetical protein GOV09_06870 [Candidatus Woesearchaeota archaeon]|nr:hypothetical protein [Candidatus Woesearchaeota archaeon]